MITIAIIPDSEEPKNGSAERGIRVNYVPESTLDGSFGVPFAIVTSVEPVGETVCKNAF